MADDREHLEYAQQTPAKQASFSAKYEEVLMREAHEMTEKGDYRGAAGIFNDIVRRFGVVLEDKQTSLVYSELATLYFWLADYDSAKKFAEKALAYGNNNDHAYSILGKCAAAQFKFPLARSYFIKISDDNPSRPLGFCLICIKLRDTKGAETYLREAALKVSPNDPEYAIYSAYVRLLKGDNQSAVLTVRDIAPKCGKNPELLALIAEIFMTAGNYGEASSTARKVLQFSPDHDQAWAVLAHAAYAGEDFAAADAYARNAVGGNPFNIYAKTAQMKLAVRRGAYDVAAGFGEEALKQSPDYSLVHANLGDVYFIQGAFGMARAEYGQTMELMDSNTKGARLRQARIRFMDADYGGAAEILEGLTGVYHTYYDDAACDLLMCYEKFKDAEKKADLMGKMQIRRGFYHRTEKLLKELGDKK